MGHGGRVRRAVMRSAGLALALSVATWAVSLFIHIEWCGTPRYEHFWLSKGGFEVGTMDMRGLVGRPGWSAGYMPMSPDWYWPQLQSWRDPTGRLLWLTYLPLWFPASISAVALGGTVLIGRRARALARAGHCPNCNYDLTGLDGPCPECGNQPTNPTRRGASA